MATAGFRGALGAAANGGAKETPALTVSTLSKKSEVGIQTLIGDYVERGSNHGKKFFQKVQAIEGHEDIKVFMYYWDARDGADFSGWWFGDQLGGTQVWARSPSHTQNPPRVGWKIPWDAEKAELGALFVDPYKPGATAAAGAKAAQAAKAAAQPAKAAAPLIGNKGNTVPPPGKGGPAVGPSSAAASPSTAVGAQSASASERVQKAKEAVENAETSAKESVSQAKELINNADATEEELKQIQEMLQQQLTSLLELPKALMNDINEVKKGGWPAQPLVTELSKLIPKARTLQASLTTEITKTRGQLIQAQQKAANAKKQAELAEKKRVAEENDSKDLSESLPETLNLVSSAEDAVENVCSMADPLVADPPDDDGDTLKSLMDEIERAAADAQNRIIEARKVTNAKLQAARKYTPTVQKTAVAEYSSQQQKLTDAQKKLNPYKTFRKEFKARVEVRKALADMAEKMDGAELEVEKASLMCSASDQSQMSEDEVGGAEKLILPAQHAITKAIQTVDLKLKTASETMKTELNLLKDRGMGARKKLESIVATLRKQREGLTVQQLRTQVSEMADKAEQMLVSCQEAEMPFLKGIEVLPEEESGTAIAECEKAAAQADKAVNEAKAFIRRKQQEIAKMSKETSTGVAAELNEQLERADSVGKKVAIFRKDTTERKTAALVSDIVDVITTAENKAQAMAKVCEVLADNLETVSTDDLKEAVEKASAAEKEASAACLEARKCISSKSKESKQSDMTLAIAKLQGRLNTTQQEIAKNKKLADSGNKLIKGKAVMVEEEGRIKEAEDEVEKVEKLVNVAEGEELTDVAVQEMGNSVVNSQKVLKSSLSCVQAHMPGAIPVVKAALQKLVDRGKAAQEKLNKVLVATKDQRERVLAEAYVKEGTKKTDEVEEALERVNKAELPFLKGLEFLPLNEANETIQESEAAAAAVQKAIGEARNFVASKNLEVKQFREAVAKPAAEGFGKQSERINAVAAKLSQFKKETEARKKTALIQEAGEKINKIEEDVKSAEEAVEPFAKGEVDDMSTDAAFDLCQKLLQQFKDLYSKLDESRIFISSRLQDCKAAGQPETLQKLQTRLSEARTKTAKTKAVVSGREQAIVAKKLISEAQDNVTELEEAVQKATETCAPLLEHGGEEFLVDSSVQRLAGAVQIYLGEKDLTIEDMFKQLAGDEDGKVPENSFAEFLEKLPETIGKEEITCTEERRVAIFNHVDEEKAGTINLEKFRKMLAVTYVCKSSITLTEEFEIATSKTIGKVEPKDELEALGFPKVETATGMTRVHCKMRSSGQAGFVTMLGNAGTVYLDTASAYETFVNGMDQKLADTMKKANEVSEFFKKKSAELAATKTPGPLTESRNDLIKLRMKVTGSTTALDQLKKKVSLAKKEFVKKEEADKDAHIEIREKKAAAVATAEINSKLEAMEGLAKQLEEAAAPLLSLKASELDAFTTPASLKDEVGNLSVSLTKCIAEVRKFREEQLSKIKKEIKGPMLDVKRELSKLEMKASATSKKCEKTTTDVEQACLKIVETIYAQASSHLRSECQKKSVTSEALFSEWLNPGEDRISESTFCERLQSQESLALKPEQALLLCRQIERGGIGRRKFCSFLQQYFTVVKPIAITKEFDISKATIIRTSDVDEVIEVLEGPCGDETLGLLRIKGKSMTDGMEGWVSVKGNKGTPFLQKVLKPYYACTKEVRFELENGGERTLNVDEVLELVEGPRKQIFNPGLRVRGKACSDGATGWFSVKNRSDVALAEADGKYYMCTTSVAMTDAADIKNCNVVRKLDKGEMFTALGEPEEDKGSGILRIEGKALKDEKVGWITIKGNAGTIYADASSKHYTILTETPLQKGFASETSDTVRMLAAGEAIHNLEGPKEEAYPPEIRMKGRLLSDDTVGWITKADNVRPWSPYYKCLTAAPLRVSDDAESEVIRQLSVGETVELLEGPTEQSKEVRMKARAEKDGAVGWVTIKTADGKKLMQS